MTTTQSPPLKTVAESSLERISNEIQISIDTAEATKRWLAENPWIGDTKAIAVGPYIYFEPSDAGALFEHFGYEGWIGCLFLHRTGAPSIVLHLPDGKKIPAGVDITETLLKEIFA